MSLRAGVVGWEYRSPDGGPIGCPGNGLDCACEWYGCPYCERRRSLPSMKEISRCTLTPEWTPVSAYFQNQLRLDMRTCDRASSSRTTNASPFPLAQSCFCIKRALSIIERQVCRCGGSVVSKRMWEFWKRFLLRQAKGPSHTKL